MTRRNFWFTSVIVVGVTAGALAACLLWMVWTEPVALARVLALGH